MRPFCLGADKYTLKRLTNQVTGVRIMTFNAEGPFFRHLYLGHPTVKDHTGIGIAQTLMDVSNILCFVYI